MKVTETQSNYKRIGNTAIHIVPSDNPEHKYMALVYDHKQYIWRKADIYANSTDEIAVIARIVFGTDTEPAEDISIAIDWGDIERQSDSNKK